MADVCQTCGLAKDLCVCDTMAKEEQEIIVTKSRRRFGKFVTVVKGFDKSIDVKSLASDLKSKLACGGTHKDRTIELQGDHTRRIKEVLEEMGFSANAIKVKG